MSEGGVVNEANDSLLSNQADSGDSYVGLKKEMREYPREYDCPITQSIMHDPVTASDGHTYERSAIQYWFDTGHNTSPVTNEVLDAQKLYTNHALRKMINSRRIQLGETLIKECLSLSSRPKDSFKKIANIIEKGADLNLRDNKGNTPVSLCTAAGRTDLVQLLIDSDADLLKTNDVGDSALDIAKKRRLGELYGILETATKEQQTKLEEENQAREERRRQRDVIENNRNNSGVTRDNERNGQEGQRFPAHLGNWRIDMGRNFFPSLFTLQFQSIQPRGHDGMQPLEHQEQQVFLSRVVKALGVIVFISLIFF